MVKYISKGNLPQTADYYALLNRSDADWRDSVRQGLVFSSAGAGCLNYGNRSLITGSTTKMRWQFKLNTVAGAGTARYILSEWAVSANKRCWVFSVGTTGNLNILIGNNGGSATTVNTTVASGDTIYKPANGDFIDIQWESGIISVLVNNTTTYTADVSGTQTVIYNNNSPDLNVGGYLSGTTAACNGSLCCIKIWVDNILDTDTPKFVAPMGDKQGIDLISGIVPTVVGTVDMTARSDDASFNCDEHPFAIGTTLVGDASGCLNYGVRDLITTSTTKMRWKFKINSLTLTQENYIMSENQSSTVRSWTLSFANLTTNRLYLRVYASDFATLAWQGLISGNVQVGDVLDILFNSGIVTVYRNGALLTTTDISASATTLYACGAPLTIAGSFASIPYSLNGSLSNIKIWVDNIADNDTPKFECDYRGTAIDKISGTVPAVVGTMVYVPQIHPRLLDDSGYAGTITGPYEEFPVKPYPNTFTGNWHKLTHAYFDKSDTDIWEDFIRNSINYDSENTNRWHVDELNPSYLEKYIKPDYRNKIFCGIDKGDYAGAIMVFESGIPEILKNDLRFWRKRKYFEVATRQINIELGIEYILTGKSDSATVKIEAYNGENWIVMATGVTVTAGEYSEGITFSPYDFEGEVTYLMRVVSEVDDSVEELIDVTSDTVVRITVTTTVATENVVLNRIRLYANSIIFWGDGDSTSLTENTTYTDLTHNYAVAGSYQVKISKADKVKEFRITNNKWSNFTTYDLRNADLDYFWLNSTGSGFTVNTSHMTGWTVGTSWYLYNMPSGTYNIDSSHMTGWTVGASWSLYNMPSGTYNIDSSHMTGWTVGNSWYLNRMPAGTYNIDSSHMTGWTVDTSWYLYNMPSGTYNIDSSHMTGWTVGASWNLYNMPAGTYTLSVDTMRNWTAILMIRIYDLIDSNTGLNMMTEAEVIKVIEDIYAGRLTFTRTILILNIAGTNASLTDAGARTKVDHLRAGYDGVNTFRSWTINVNGYPV